MSTSFEIYTNKVQGNESTELVKIGSLPAKEYATRLEVAKLTQLVLVGETAAKELKDLQQNCSHHYFYDRPGFPYNSRYCAACGIFRGQL